MRSANGSGVKKTKEDEEEEQTETYVLYLIKSSSLTSRLTGRIGATTLSYTTSSRHPSSLAPLTMVLPQSAPQQNATKWLAVRSN